MKRLSGLLVAIISIGLFGGSAIAEVKSSKLQQQINELDQKQKILDRKFELG